MTFKTIIICVSAFMIQSIACNCIRPALPGPSCGVSMSNSGGDFIVTSLGPISPSGIAVASDLALDGKLDLSGSLPFLSAVGFDGTFPTSGYTAVSYGCGDGNIGITQEIGERCGCNRN